MSEQSFEELMQAYTRHELNGEGLTHFLELIEHEPYKQQFKDHITALLEQRTVSGLADEKRAGILFDNIMAAAAAQEEATTQVVPRKRVGSMRWLFPALAAALLAAIAISILYLNAPTAGSEKKTLAGRPVKKERDRLPGTQKALLTLGNGTVISLDDAQNGMLTRQGATAILKFNGRLNYRAEGTAGPETVFNTISTPRGGQYEVVLPDGSEVWLNAASSIHFPTVFGGKERIVDITGEAYFEVAKNAAVPFVVNVKGSQVKVLGTHFNVMAYDDEATLETTLFEGAVQFSHKASSLHLRPLEQSRLKPDGKLDLVENPDAEDVLAWKNGMFHFENEDLQTVMRQLSRWYDVEVEYRIPPDGNLYHLEMPRNSKLSSVLKVLEITASVHFDIEGKKIIVS